MTATPQPDPTFGATAPVPGEDISGARKTGLRQDGGTSNPAFWGRKAPVPVAQQLAARGPQPFPKMMYHTDGRMQAAETEEDFKEATANGWRDKPDVLHLELLQTGDQGKSHRRTPTAGSPESSVAAVAAGEQPKWGLVALAKATKVTPHHVQFLRARGFSVQDVAVAARIVEAMNTEEAAQFFNDAAEWKDTSEVVAK